MVTVSSGWSPHRPGVPGAKKKNKIQKTKTKKKNIRPTNDRLSGSVWQTGSGLRRQQEVMGPPATQPAANFDTSCGT